MYDILQQPKTAFKLTIKEFNTLIHKTVQPNINATIEHGLIEYTDETDEPVFEAVIRNRIQKTKYGTLVSIHAEYDDTVWIIYK